MIKIVVIVLIVLVVLVLLVLGYASTRPNNFRIQRSKSIKASPEKIFALINDYHRWTGWSPYENIDPAMKRTYSGAASGKGAVYEWEGNNKIGKGRMEITDEASPSRVTIKLDFFAPFEAHNTAEFTLEPHGDSTNVTWAMYGRSSFVAKVMHLCFSMDKMVGQEFEKGLVNLKTISES